MCRRGTFCYNRMPFGPRNAPSVFQQMMNTVLSQVLYKHCCVYLDDFIIWADTVEEVLTRTEHIIELLAQEGLVLSGIKSEFAL